MPQYAPNSKFSTALPRPPSWVEGGRFAAGEGRGGEALAVEPSHFSTGSDATEYCTEKTSVDTTDDTAWVRFNISLAPWIRLTEITWSLYTLGFRVSLSPRPTALRVRCLVLPRIAWAT